MKKITNILAKLVTAALALVVLVSASPAVAAVGPHLTDDGLGVLAVYNSTQHPNSNSYWTSSVTAQPGETVEFGIYYANDGDQTVRNVRVQLSSPGSGALASHQLTGIVFSDNSGSMQGTSRVNLPSAQTLSFDGVVNWDRNTTGAGNALTNGVNLFSSSGVSLGDIAPGEFGTVVARFRVGQTQVVTPPVQTQVDPVVTTGSVSSISQTSALVNGSIDFRGTFQNGSCFFDYGTSQSFGQTSNSQSVSSSNSQSFSSTLFNLNPNTTYFYRANCIVNGRSFTGSTLSFTTQQNVQQNIDPIVTTGSATTFSQNSALVNGTIDFRGQFQSGTCFFEYGPTTSLGSTSPTQSVSGSNTQSFSATLFNLNSATTYFYRANCQANGRTFVGSILNFQTSGFINNNQNQILSVMTNPATEIFTDSARLNGFVTTGGQINQVSAYFEYGLTTNLGLQTSVGNLGSITSSTFTSVILGLRPNTTYFFRAVSQNQNGQIVRGQILSFNTRASTVVVNNNPPVVVTPQVITPAISPIIISYGLDNVNPLPGEIVLYRIGWLNQSGTRLTNGILRVTLPSTLTFIDSQNGIARDGQTLIYPVGNIAAGGSGSISFRAAISPSVAIGTDLPIAIRMDFFNPTTAKNGDVTITGFTHVAPTPGNTVAVAGVLNPSTVIVVASSTPTVAGNTDTNSNTAFLGDIGASFFPQTAVGWLLLLILAVLIVALIRRAFAGASNA